MRLRWARSSCKPDAGLKRVHRYGLAARRVQFAHWLLLLRQSRRAKDGRDLAERPRDVAALSDGVQHFANLKSWLNGVAAFMALAAAIASYVPYNAICGV